MDRPLGVWGDTPFRSRIHPWHVPGKYVPSAVARVRAFGAKYIFFASAIRSLFSNALRPPRYRVICEG